MMFHDRTRELKVLLKAASSRKPEFYAVWGRRRVGKSELIDEFLRLQPPGTGVRFLAIEAARLPQLHMFSRTLATHFSDEILARNPFTNWDALFTYIAQKSATARFILAIDEFPFLVDEDRSLPSILQGFWDQRFSKTGALMLILCGSSIAMMERLFSGRAPLYGRRTGQIVLRPFQFQDCATLYSKHVETAVQAYSVFGGIPAYATSYDPAMDLWDNVSRTILNPAHFMSHDVDALLRQELREPRRYFSLMAAIASGAASLADIGRATGLESIEANRYLTTLTDLHWIDREVPVTESRPEKSRQGRYRIDDPYAAFWFQFVYPHLKEVEKGEIPKLIDHVIRPNFDAYVGRSWERICRELVLRLAEQDGTALPFSFTRLGRWWSKDQEIDLVGINEQDPSIAFIEIKWSRNKVGQETLETMMKKSAHVSWGSERRKESFFYISRSGFHPGAVRFARTHGILLWSLSDLQRSLDRARGVA